MDDTICINVDYYLDAYDRIHVVQDGEFRPIDIRTLSTIWLARPILSPPSGVYGEWAAMLLKKNLLAWSEDLVCSEKNIAKMHAGIVVEMIDKYMEYVKKIA